MKTVKTARYIKMAFNLMEQQFINQIKGVDGIPPEVRLIFVNNGVQPYDIANSLAVNDNLEWLVSQYTKNKDQKMLDEIERIVSRDRRGAGSPNPAQGIV